MNNPKASGTGTQHGCAEAKCGGGLRNNYFEGKRLSVDSFRIEQKYMLERHRLVNRAMHGWGVVYGFEVTAPCDGSGLDSLTIGPGLALDKCGRELLQTQTRIEFGDVVILDEKFALVEDKAAWLSAATYGCDPGDWCWLLSAHYAEQRSAPVTIQDPCRCEQHEWDHTCEAVRYSLQRIPCGKCCAEFECELKCCCATGPCCDPATDAHDGRPRAPYQRGGCRCLCEHLTSLPMGNECCSLREIEVACTRVLADLRNGVPLACVELVRDKCDHWTFGRVIDACGPRRLVKRNDLLFDLIRGCDLTRISGIGWKDWHRRSEPIDFGEFSAALGDIHHGETEYVTKAFWVRFSRPVREDSLRPDCFAMTVMSLEREGGWWQTFRVPIVRVEFAEFGEHGHAGHVRGARIVVDGAWVEDSVRGRRSLFIGSETRVELEIRGDFIIDCNGQPVDANAVGLNPFPSGNGTPGGTFLSTFRVSAAEEGPYQAGAEDGGRRYRGAS